jgi:CheY-like chemotaxis protein
MAKILIVDDDPDICFMLKRLLERSGHEATTASNGFEALNCLDQGLFEIVVADIIMPDMDGIELIMTIRVKHPLLKVIAMSGGGRISAEEYLKMARLLKVNHTFQKPIKTAEFLNVINDLLTGSAYILLSK